MKNFNLLYFSPTGGTKRVAELFAKALGEHFTNELWDISVDCWDADFNADETVVFFFPVYGGRIPAPMYDRVSKLTGHNTRAVLIAVFGNRAVDDALIEMSDLVKQRGFYTAAAGQVVAPHSLNTKVGAGRPDASDIQKINAFVEKLISAEGDKAIGVPGSRPYREYKGIPLHPSSGRKCSLCMACQDNCPAHAIPEKDPSTVDKKLCISCMRCINICTIEVRSVPAAARLAVELSVKKLCGEGRREPEFYI